MRHISNENWSISELLQIIKQEMEAREIRDYIQIEGTTATKPVEPLPTAKSLMRANIGTTSVFVS